MNSRLSAVFLIVIALYSVIGFSAEATTSGAPLAFKLWKEHQVVEAKNHVVRLSNRIHLLKTGRYKSEGVRLKEEAPLLGEEGEADYQNLKDSSAAAQVDKETLAEAEKRVLEAAQERMKNALGNLQYAKELSVEDYLAVYLSQFKDDDEALRKVVKKMSEQELVEVIRGQMKSDVTAEGGSASTGMNSVISELQPESRPQQGKPPKSL